MQRLEDTKKPPTVFLHISKHDPTKSKNIIVEEKITVKFLVGEILNGEEKVFPIQNRSKGFLWFFTFILKTALNPKKDMTGSGDIYLLDEPGCYLHSTAQKGLCKVLEELSEKAVVLYNTHSHFLLQESFFPNIKIAHKDKNLNIKLDHFSHVDAKAHYDALEPLRNALHVEPSIIEKSLIPENTLLTEGIRNFYSWDLFIDEKERQNIGIIPSTGGNNIPSLLCIMLGLKKNVVCLLDNDNKGEEIKKSNSEFEDYLHLLENYKTIEDFYDKNEIDKFLKEHDIDQNTDINVKYLIPIIYKKLKSNDIELQKVFKKTKRNFNNYWSENIVKLWETPSQ